MNFGYGGPERQVSKPLLRSMNQVPVISNGALGRGFLRLAGASAPSCVGGSAAFWARAGSAVNMSAPAMTGAMKRFLRADMIPPGDILARLCRLGFSPEQIRHEPDGEHRDGPERHRRAVVANKCHRLFAVPE